MAAVQMLRKDPNAMTLNAVMDSKPFKSLVAQLLHCVPNTEGAITMCYLKDIPSLLAMISAVRECDLERHLQSERDSNKLSHWTIITTPDIAATSMFICATWIGRINLHS